MTVKKKKRNPRILGLLNTKNQYYGLAGRWMVPQSLNTKSYHQFSETISLQTLIVSLSLLVVLDRALLVPKCATCQYKSPLRSSLSATDIFLPGFTSSLVFATFFLHPAISSSSSQVLIFIIIFLLILGHLSLVSSLIHSFKHLSNSTKFQLNAKSFTYDGES